MKALTLRHVRPGLARAIKQATGKTKKSKASHHDLDHLAGSWSLEQGRSFKKNLAKQRMISSELWIW